MPFTPHQLPSGRWRGGFKHPVTKKPVWATKDHQGRPFDYRYEAEAWSVTEENKARERAAESGAPVAAAPAAPPTVPSPPGAAAGPRWVGPTVGEYGRAYLDRRRGSLEGATVSGHETHLRGLAKPIAGADRAPAAAPMGLLTRNEIQTWQTASVAAGEGRSAINSRLKLLRALYADLIDDPDIPITHNPASAVELLATDATPTRVVSPDEEQALLSAADEQLRAAIVVALDCGLRWQEVYGLRACAVGGDYLTVSHVVTRAGKLRAYTKGRRKNGSSRHRVVPMTARVVETLRPFVQQAPGGEALLFPALGRRDRPGMVDAYRPWNYHNHLHREWGPTLARAGLATVTERPTGRVRKYTTDKGEAGSPIMRTDHEPRFGFHALRHSYGTRLAAKGVPRREIAELMGHADEATTGIYTHAGDDGTRAALVRAALEPERQLSSASAETAPAPRLRRLGTRTRRPHVAGHPAPRRVAR